MNKLINKFSYLLICFFKKTANCSINTLSMIGMYEPEPPEELIK